MFLFLISLLQVILRADKNIEMQLKLVGTWSREILEIHLCEAILQESHGMHMDRTLQFMKLNIYWKFLCYGLIFQIWHADNMWQSNQW